MNVIGLLLTLFLLPLALSTPLTETPTPAQTHSSPPPTAFPGLDFTKPPELARTTPASGDELARAQGGGADVPFRQETYYSCVTWDTTTHCGWHMPIVWVGEAGVEALRARGQGLVIGVVVLVVGFMMW